MRMYQAYSGSRRTYLNLSGQLLLWEKRGVCFTGLPLLHIPKRACGCGKDFLIPEPPLRFLLSGMKSLCYLYSFIIISPATH